MGCLTVRIVEYTVYSSRSQKGGTVTPTSLLSTKMSSPLWLVRLILESTLWVDSAYYRLTIKR